MSKKFSMKDLLNEASKNESAPGAADSPGFDIRHIDIEKICPSPINRYGLRDIEELAASIEEIGLLHNITVYDADDNGLYMITSGERRYMACKLLFDNGNDKYATMPCKVEPRESPEMDELKLIHANATARVLTDYEKTMQAGRIKEILQKMKSDGHKFTGRMRDIVADILKVSPAQMGRMESINKNLNPEIKAVFERGEIGITDAYKASKLSTDEQAAALDNFEKTGEFNAERPTATPGAEAAIQAKIEEYKARDAKKAPKMPMDDENSLCNICEYYHNCKSAGAECLRVREIMESGKTKAFASLHDEKGRHYETSGSIAVIAAIDGEEFEGYISEGDAGATEHVMLATAILGEFFQRIGDDRKSRKMLIANIAGLLDKGGK